MPTVTLDPQTGHLLVDGKPVEPGQQRGFAQTPLGREGWLLSGNTDGSPGYRWFNPNMATDEGGQFPASAFRNLSEEERQILGDRIVVPQGIGGPGEAIDASRVTYHPGLGFMTTQDNIRPQEDSNLERIIGAVPGIAFAVGMGGLLGQGLGLWGDPFAGFGDAAGAGSGSGAGSVGAPPFDPYMGGAANAAGSPVAAGTVGATAPAAGAGSGAGTGAAGAGTYAGPFAPGMEGAGMLDSFLINNGMSGLAGGPLTAALGGNLGAAGQGLLSTMLANPLGTAGAAYTLSGLLGGGDGPSGSPGGSTGPVGLLDPTKFQRPQWTPNQHTLSQLNQLYGGIYGGG